jgi:hypothetical protein
MLLCCGQVFRCFTSVVLWIIANLIGKGWIECRQARSGRTYRLTELGLQAMKTPLPKSSSSGRSRSG